MRLGRESEKKMRMVCVEHRGRTLSSSWPNRLPWSGDRENGLDEYCEKLEERARGKMSAELKVVEAQRLDKGGRTVSLPRVLAFLDARGSSSSCIASGAIKIRLTTL